MTKAKSTKRALLLSGLALLLCVSMLVGSTFAWFTDTVKSGNNIIQSGNLDVQLFYAATAADVTSDNWTEVDTTTDVFGYDNWEPGFTKVVYFKVKNNGSLALKYQLSANSIGSEEPGVNRDGGTFHLSNYIQCALIDTSATRESILAMNGTTFGGNYDLSGDRHLSAGNSDVIGLALWMPTSVGDVANHNGTDIPSISFAINLLATQYTEESDSFGPDYDEGLVPGEGEVTRTLDDGTVVTYVDGGAVYLTELPENLGNEYVVPSVVTHLGGTLAGADLDKLTIPASVTYGKKSLLGATIDEVVLEDGITTIPNRLFYQTTVGSVVIPDSVTVIEESVFQQSDIKEVVIPASVTTLGKAAFAGSKIETVTFEGNTAIQGYAFRGCTELRTVYLNGDDVTFVAAPDGTNSMWFCNGESGNPNTSDIDFYVVNETVAARVKTAMAHEANNTDVYVNGAAFVSVKNVTEFQAALDNAVNNTIISLTADVNGDVSFTQQKGVSLVLDGNDKVMNGSINITARAGNTDTATLTIKNFNFETTDTDRDFIRSVETNYYPNNLTVSNCTFKGTGADSDVVAVSVKSASNLVIEDCKADNVHSLLQNAGGGWNYTVRRCKVTNAGRGLNLHAVQGALIEVVTIEASAEKYGVRINGAYAATATFIDCKISAFCPVVVRAASANYTLVFKGENTMTAANTDGIWCAIGTSEYEENGVMPTAATGNVTVTLTDAGLAANGVYGASVN